MGGDKIENNIKSKEANEEKGDFIKIKRPPGRPPTKFIPSIIYWVYVVIGTIIETVFANLILFMALVGGVSGYYIGHSFELVLIGIIMGIVFGFIFFEGK